MITFTGASGTKYKGAGPYDETGSLQDTSGVYVILGRNTDSEKWKVVDVGEGKGIKTRVETHTRKSCWTGRQYTALAVSPIYTPNKQKTGRMEIEQDLRGHYNPPCGER
ncbi:MAG: hypothetical protein KDB68_09815 [Planctomycetes bacterium]|nr:hypothetical protein [Planctomycetota bacterium]